jgi:hypothetical protein
MLDECGMVNEIREFGEETEALGENPPQSHIDLHKSHRI